MRRKNFLSEDYIFQLISGAVKVLAKILGLKTAGNYAEAQKLIDETLTELTGLPADMLRRYDDQAILEVLTVNDNLDLERLWVVAQLFQEQGDIQAAQGNQRVGYLDRLRALNFYLEVVLTKGLKEYSQPVPEIETLLTILADADFGENLTEETLFNLYCYHELVGSFSAADQALARLAAFPGLEREIRNERKDFYERLIKKSDAELHRGNLEREQVMEWLKTI